MRRRSTIWISIYPRPSVNDRGLTIGLNDHASETQSNYGSSDDRRQNGISPRDRRPPVLVLAIGSPARLNRAIPTFSLAAGFHALHALRRPRSPADRNPSR